MTVAKLTEGLNLIEAGMTVLENIDSDEQSAATTRRGLENSLCRYKEILREKEIIIGSNSIGRIFQMLKESNCAARRTINYKLTTY